MKKFREVIWGSCLILIGVIFFLNALDITDINIFFPGWWTLFIIVPCFIGLFTEDYFGNMIGFLIGMALLASCQGWISFGTIAKLIFPVALIIIGLNILLRGKIHSKVNEKMKALNTIDGKSVVAIFGSQDLKVTEKYLGGDVEAIFGSIDLDISEAKLETETPIKINAIFGGVTIQTPKDVNVIVKSVPIFGGVESKVKSNEKAKKTIYIEAVAVFGGVEIK